MARYASMQMDSIAVSMASAPPFTGYSMDRVTARSLSVCRFLMTAISRLVRMGRSTSSAAVPFSSGSIMLATLPIITREEVTILSRTPSIGGFVTWAKFCWK